MEIIEHERVLLVNSLIQTISELYEHDGDDDGAALGALLTRMTGGRPGTRATRAGSRMSRPARQVPKMTAHVRTPRF